MSVNMMADNFRLSVLSAAMTPSIATSRAVGNR
jgi:hypothetical protein